jgi:hypothetical protein
MPSFKTFHVDTVEIAWFGENDPCNLFAERVNRCRWFLAEVGLELDLFVAGGNTECMRVSLAGSTRRLWIMGGIRLDVSDDSLGPRNFGRLGPRQAKLLELLRFNPMTADEIRAAGFRMRVLDSLRRRGMAEEVRGRWMRYASADGIVEIKAVPAAAASRRA